MIREGSEKKHPGYTRVFFCATEPLREHFEGVERALKKAGLRVALLRLAGNLPSPPQILMDTPISALLERKGSVVYSVPSTFSVAEAVAEMNRCRVGAIVVIDRDHLVGIFTERDVLRRVVGAGIDPVQTPVSEVMSTSVMTITPEATIEDTMNVFTQKRCRHLPVVAQNQLVGVVSIGDVTRWVTDLHRTEAEHLKNYIAGSVIA